MLSAAFATASDAGQGPSPESRLFLLAGVLSLALLALLLLLLFTVARSTSRVRALRERVRDLEDRGSHPGASPWSLAGRRARAPLDDAGARGGEPGGTNPDDPVGAGGP